MDFAASVPGFKAALVTRLAATAALATGTTTVSRGLPYPKRWGREAVLIGQMTNFQTNLVGGMSQRRERYDVEIAINVSGSPQTPYEDYEERAYALAAAVDTSLTEWSRTGATLCSGTWGQVVSAIPEYVRDEEGIEEDDKGVAIGRDCTVYMTVHVIAAVVGSV